MTRDYYELPKSSSIMRFLWKCAGGDRFLLERATYSDQIKYMCLGGIVFATGAMAGLAGGYAFYTIFSPRGNAIDTIKQKYASNPELMVQMTKEAIGNLHQQEMLVPILSILFGVIWGLIIFNIDRFIVTSTGKGDGTEEITKKEFKSAIPRIIMGIIIAITISKPVEIRMFKTEIDNILYEKQKEQQASYIKKTEANFKNELDKKNAEIKKFEDNLSIKIQSHKFLETQYIEEARIITVGPRAKAIKEQMEKVEGEITDINHNPEYIRLKNEKQNILKRLDDELKNNKTIADNLDGLLERIIISHEIAPWISFFITLLFMAIELTPIFFKLMLTKTTYDYLTENRDELIKADYGIEVKYDYYKAKINKDDKEGKEGVERHLTINHEAEKLIYEKIKVTEIQKELTDYAVQKYKEREMKKIDENLDTYIKSIDKNEQDI